MPAVGYRYSIPPGWRALGDRELGSLDGRARMTLGHGVAVRGGLGVERALDAALGRGWRRASRPIPGGVLLAVEVGAIARRLAVLELDGTLIAVRLDARAGAEAEAAGALAALLGSLRVAARPEVAEPLLHWLE